MRCCVWRKRRRLNIKRKGPDLGLQAKRKRKRKRNNSSPSSPSRTMRRHLHLSRPRADKRHRHRDRTRPLRPLRKSHRAQRPSLRTLIRPARHHPVACLGRLPRLYLNPGPSQPKPTGPCCLDLRFASSCVVFLYFCFLFRPRRLLTCAPCSIVSFLSVPVSYLFRSISFHSPFFHSIRSIARPLVRRL